MSVDVEPVFVGEFFASGFASAAGLVGGGVGKEGVSGGFPAGADVAQVTDDEGGVFAEVVGGADGVVFGAGCLVAPVEDPDSAQGAEGDGVVAAFGEEVAAESEHVGPAAQPGVAGVVAELPAGVHEPFGVAAVRAGVQVDGVVGEAGGGVAGGFGGFGGVFGEVSGDHGVGDRVAAAQGDHAHVHLCAPADEPPAGLGLVRGRGEGDGGGGLVDGVVQVGGGDLCRWRDDRVGVAGVEAVQAQEGVEVDGAAGLEFGGFAVGDPDRRHCAGVAFAVGDPHRWHATAAGELAEVAFDSLLGAPPQLS